MCEGGGQGLCGEAPMGPLRVGMRLRWLFTGHVAGLLCAHGPDLTYPSHQTYEVGLLSPSTYG